MTPLTLENGGMEAIKRYSSIMVMGYRQGARVRLCIDPADVHLIQNRLQAEKYCDFLLEAYGDPKKHF